MKTSTKESLKTCAMVAMWPVILVFLGVGTCVVRQHQCDVVCVANGDSPMYLIAEGCYCKTSTGTYNPKDSR